MQKSSHDLGWESGLAFLLDPTRNTSPKPHLQKVLPCKHPCQSWDLGLGTPCESRLGTSMLSTVENAWIDLMWLGTPWEPALNVVLRAGLHYGGEAPGHEKNGISQLWLVENANLDRRVFILGEENNGGKFFSWMIKWHGHLRGGAFWSWASPKEEFLIQPQEAGHETSTPEKPNSKRNILLPLILLRHIHHLPHS